MSEPGPTALEMATAVANSWRQDGRLGQLEAHIAPAIQEVIEQRDAAMLKIGDVWGERNRQKARADQAEAASLKATAQLAWLIMTLRHDITVAREVGGSTVHIAILEATLGAVVKPLDAATEGEHG